MERRCGGSGASWESRRAERGRRPCTVPRAVPGCGHPAQQQPNKALPFSLLDLCFPLPSHPIPSQARQNRITRCSAQFFHWLTAPAPRFVAGRVTQHWIARWRGIYSTGGFLLEPLPLRGLRLPKSTRFTPVRCRSLAVWQVSLQK